MLQAKQDLVYQLLQEFADAREAIDNTQRRNIKLSEEQDAILRIYNESTAIMRRVSVKLLDITSELATRSFQAPSSRLAFEHQLMHALAREIERQYGALVITMQPLINDLRTYAARKT